MSPPARSGALLIHPSGGAQGASADQPLYGWIPAIVVALNRAPPKIPGPGADLVSMLREENRALLHAAADRIEALEAALAVARRMSSDCAR